MSGGSTGNGYQSPAPSFDRGGYIAAPRDPVLVRIAECVARAADVRAGRWVCCRSDAAHLKAAQHGPPEARETSE